MTELEYLTRIQEIRNSISDTTAVDIDRQMEELFAYKPVRLLWYELKAEIDVARGADIDSVWSSVGTHWFEWAETPGVLESWRFHLEQKKLYGMEIDIQFSRNRYRKIAGLESNQVIEVKAAYEKYISSGKQEKNEALAQLMNMYYAGRELLLFIVIRIYLINQQVIADDSKTNIFFEEPNFGYLRESLLQPNRPFVLVEDATSSQECELLKHILCEMGHSVYFFSTPVLLEEQVDIFSEEVMEICLSNVIYDAGISTFTPLAICREDGSILDNRALLLEYVRKSIGYGLVLTTGQIFLELLNHPLLRKNIECLTENNEIYGLEDWNFGWFGNYTQYISDVYDVDAEAELNAEPICDFSIIIPSRNAAGTLKYTLQTCLNQNYNGDFEIVVSDNSTDGREEVWQVCEDIGDSRIKYYKTPRNLSLSKSFEYAYLKSRGRFLFSIGADDGVCPWALATLSEVMKQYPDENVIQWERGYYAWSNFVSSDRDKMVIPGQHSSESYEVKYIDNIDYFARALKDTSYIYSLPLLYINSGCKRSYFKTIVERTGRLLDGCNQDIYMGVMNAAINEKILNIKLPLTIAGMSDNSLGYVSVLPSRTNKEKDIMESTFKGDNVGIYVMNGVVCNVPHGTGETCSFYVNVHRAIQLGVLPDSWKEEVLDYKKIFRENFLEHSKLDEKSDAYLHYARFQAMKRGKDFLDWYDQEIYIPNMQPVYYDNSKEKHFNKSYTEGPTAGGGLILDASYYDVTNIEQATELFAKMIYWTPDKWKKEMGKREKYDS